MTEPWIIAAISENNVIGNRGALPWRIPQDLARFKALTMGHTMIMGRKTFESIGRVLPGRTTVVLTRRPGFEAPGVLAAADPEAALALARGPHVFIVGGADIYRVFLPLAKKLLLTRVHEVSEGDTFFPAYDPSEWLLVSEQPHPATGSAPAFTFQDSLRVHR